MRTLGDLGEPGPVVLAGGLPAAGTPVRDGVLRVLSERGRKPRTSLDPAAGAAWLAGRPLSPLDPADLHRAMLGGVA
ncbi:hypothetical protein [Actinoplanes lobatus]|uniref:ATPase n=1 Tax=Actinoplanes lobatus TaxID=113568 RepID=A0A7W7HN98_9ACTN|nr:hypothetical protein [Actinoplanes lobatus]MBB4753687.1 hypothetical protein [Actinoplanes lobatus]